MVSYDLIIIYNCLKNRFNLCFFLSLSIVFSIGYVYLLNSLIIGTFYVEKIYLNFHQIIFAISIGILLSLITILNYQSFKNRISTVKGSVIGAILATFVNGFCCSPAIPTIISFFASASPAMIFYAASIQAFFAFNYLYFYIISIFLFVYSIHKLCNNIKCCVLKNEK